MTAARRVARIRRASSANQAAAMSAKSRIADSAIKPSRRQLLPTADRPGFVDQIVEARQDSHPTARHAINRRPDADRESARRPFTSCLQKSNRTDSQNRRIAILGVISKAESSPGAI